MLGKGKRHGVEFEVGGGRVGRVVQADTTGNAGVAGVHTSIKYSLMLKGLLMCYRSDP